MSQNPYGDQYQGRQDGPTDWYGQGVPPQQGQQAFGTPDHPYQQPYQQAQPYQPQPYQQIQPYQQPYPVAVQPKNPGLALLVSFFIPGLGSILNNDVSKGVLILVGYVICAALSWLIVPIIGMVGLWIWGMVDAYQGANAWNRRHGFLT